MKKFFLLGLICAIVLAGCGGGGGGSSSGGTSYIPAVSFTDLDVTNETFSYLDSQTDDTVEIIFADDNTFSMTRGNDDGSSQSTGDWSVDGQGNLVLSNLSDQAADVIITLSIDTDQEHKTAINYEKADSVGPLENGAMLWQKKDAFASTTFNDSTWFETSDGMRFVFNQDGTGTLTEESGDIPFDWSVNAEGQLIITTESIETGMDSRWNVMTTTTTEKRVLTLWSGSTTQDIYSSGIVLKTIDVNGSILGSADTPTEQFCIELLNESALPAFSNDDLSASNLFSYSKQDGERVEHVFDAQNLVVDLETIAAGSDSPSPVPQVSTNQLDWQINASGSLTVTDSATGDYTEYVLVAADTEKIVMFGQKYDINAVLGSELPVIAYKGALGFEESWLSSRTVWQSNSSSDTLEFNADGNFYESSVSSGTWQVNANGVLQLLYGDGSSADIYYNFETGDDNAGQLGVEREDFDAAGNSQSVAILLQLWKHNPDPNGGVVGPGI